MPFTILCQAPLENARNSPWSKGAVTFASFVAFGSVPLVAYTALDSSFPNGNLSQLTVLAL
jgi:hypothetical protein